MGDRPAGRRAVAAAVAVATIAQALLARPFSLTFLADDYGLLAEAREPDGLNLREFGAYWSRIPVWGLVTWVCFRSRIWEATWLPMHLFFALHATAVTLLLRWWLQRAGIAVGGRIFVLIVAIVALQPNAYEILYWPTTMAYTIGALFLALAIVTRRTAWRVVAFALSFLTLETFVLPALGFLVAGEVLERQRRAPEWRGRVWLPWIGAFVLYLAVRFLAGRIFGSYPYHVSMDLLAAARRMLEAGGIVVLIHFHRIFWPASLVQALAVTLMTVWLLRRRIVTARLLLTLALIGFLSTVAYWMLGYGAPRALYGSGLLFGTVVGWLLGAVAVHARPRFKLAVGLVACAYVAQNLVMFSIKDHNARALATRERALVAELRTCAAPCTLSVARPDQGLRRDWVVPPSHWEAYFRWIRARHAAGREVTFRVMDREGTPERLISVGAPRAD